MKTPKKTSVAFSGYNGPRLLKLLKSHSDPGSNIKANIEQIATKTSNIILELHNSGFNSFYVGMSSGYEIIAALEVLKLRQTYRDINLIAIVPFVGQDDKYCRKDKVAYIYILQEADEVVILSEIYNNNTQFLRCTDHILDHVTQLVCYHEGEIDDTIYIFNRAIEKGINIKNIYE